MEEDYSSRYPTGAEVPSVLTEVSANNDSNKVWKIINFVWIIVLLLIYAYSILGISYCFLGGARNCSIDSPIIVLIYLLEIVGLLAIIFALRAAIKEFKQEISYRKWLISNLIPLYLCIGAAVDRISDIHFIEGLFILPFLYTPFLTLPVIGKGDWLLIFPIVYLAVAAFRPKENFRSWFIGLFGIELALIFMYFYRYSTTVTESLKDLQQFSYLNIAFVIIPLTFILYAILERVVKSLQTKISNMVIGIVLLLVSAIMICGGLFVDSKSAAGKIVNARVVSQPTINTPVEKLVFTRENLEAIWITDSSGSSPVKLVGNISSYYYGANLGALSPDEKHYAYLEYLGNVEISNYGHTDTHSKFNLHLKKVDDMSDSVLNTETIIADYLPHLKWSQDGKIMIDYYYLSRPRELAYDINGQTINYDSLATFKTERLKVISPDGRYKLESVSKIGKSGADKEYGYTQYYIIDNQDNKTIRLPKNYTFGRWLNDGRRFVSISPNGLCIIDVDGNIFPITDKAGDRVAIEQ